MAEVAEGAEAPVEGFRFAARELDTWATGEPRELIPNRDVSTFTRSARKMARGGMARTRWQLPVSGA